MLVVGCWFKGQMLIDDEEEQLPLGVIVEPTNSYKATWTTVNSQYAVK